MKIHRDALLGKLPPEWQHDVRLEIRERVTHSGKIVVVFDDDPTGCQTVHGVRLITDWSVEAFAAEFLRGASLFYVLTNTRSLSETDAAAVNREAASNLAAAAAEANVNFVLVSRGDSTLRGHFPTETNAISEGLGYRPDAVLLIPNFVEGGRITCGDVHYVLEGEWFVPVGETEFARDPSFGFHSSYLPDWIAECSPTAPIVRSVSLDDIRIGGPAMVAERLRNLPFGSICIVNAVTQRDLEVATLGILMAEAVDAVGEIDYPNLRHAHRFLYRTAASFVPIRAGQPPRALLTAETLGLKVQGGGLIVAGSHVARTTSQLNSLRAAHAIVDITLDAACLQGDNAQAEICRAIAAIDRALSEERNVLVQTSRSLITGATAADSLAIARRISNLLVAVVRGLSCVPRYIIAKGGITSHDIATKALGAKRVEVLGQIAPGVPAWRLGTETAMPGSVYIVFPGNVGDASTLTRIVAALQNDSPNEGESD